VFRITSRWLRRRTYLERNWEWKWGFTTAGSRLT
jgi:hypothetical protein